MLSFDAKKMLLIKKNDYFLHIRQIFGILQNVAGIGFFTIAFIKVVLVNKHRAIISHSKQLFCDKKTSDY